MGKSIAAKLSPNHQVIILSRNQEKLEAVSKEINCDFVVADVSDYSSLRAAVEIVLGKYKKIDVLINNAGIWVEGKLEENDPKKIQEVLNVNTLGTIFLTKAVLPSMKSLGSGRIINIISQDGLNAKSNRSIYTASKWAITGFTKCLQVDLSEDNIGVTGIYPGLLKTGLFEKQGAKRNLSQALDPSEVASVIEYVINLTPGTLLPDIGIKNINNSTNMDDTNSSQITLDINPDMITPQTGTPQATPLSGPPIPPGVIDITPGASPSADVHPPKIEDITPVATTGTSFADSPPQVLKPISDTPTLSVTPAVTHLVDVIPQALPSLPDLSTPAPSVPSEAPSVQVELPPATPVNPLSEDPDLVKLVK
ncbi:MAG: Estradiol 17-beta-dehydrogenase [Candidatus Collierbacteria bacterium GW2011_GWB1_44_197]|nr:MAG: Estradiol 17-beta-dehydrogenase [Candidatus Collierbacteria bacterium GW2011_GWB1_44_197]